MQRFKLRRVVRSGTIKHSLIVAATVVTGLSALQLSHAATFAVNSEAERGTVAGNTAAGDPVGASGNAAVRFGGSATPPSPPSGGQSCPAYPAFPNVNCTGVPSGYSLTSVSSLSTTTNGQTIDGKLITGDLNVDHDNITVTNSRIKGRVNSTGHKGLVLQDVDLGPDACPAANNGGVRLITSDSGYTLIRSHLHNNGDDVLITGGGPPVTIRDSLINNTCFYTGDHLDAVQFYDPGGVGNVTIAHSNIDVRPANSSDKGNAAIFWADTPGRGSTLTVYQSLLAGGGITLAPYDSGAGSGVTIDIHDNKFVKNSYSGSACFLGQSSPANHSPTIPFNGTEGIKWSNNSYDDSTTLSSCQ